jgi:hypothetical protein
MIAPEGGALNPTTFGGPAGRREGLVRRRRIKNTPKKNVTFLELPSTIPQKVFDFSDTDFHRF